VSIYSTNDIDEVYSNSSSSLIYSSVREGSVVLDIGCSTGNMADKLTKEKGCMVDGIEPDADDARVARKRCRIVLEKDVNHYNFSDLTNGSYDYIILCNVLEHLTNPENTLKNCKKLLKKDGKILFSVPNISNITTRMDLLFGSFDYEDEGILDRTHYKYFTKKTLFNLFAESGYKIDNYYASTKEIEESVIGERFGKLGIQVTPELKELLYSEESLTYEHIGIASPGMGVRIKDNIDNKIERLQNIYIRKLEIDSKKMKNYIAKLEKELADEHAEIIRLSTIPVKEGSLPGRVLKSIKHHIQNEGKDNS